MPLFAAASCVHSRYTPNKTTVLCSVWMLENLDSFNGIDRQIQTKITGGRIGCIQTIYKKSALLFIRALDTDLAGRGSHDSDPGGDPAPAVGPGPDRRTGPARDRRVELGQVYG